jgi:hypothetical protein
MKHFKYYIKFIINIKIIILILFINLIILTNPQKPHGLIFNNIFLEINIILFLLTIISYWYNYLINKSIIKYKKKLKLKEKINIEQDEKKLKENNIKIDIVLKIKNLKLKSKKYSL